MLNFGEDKTTALAMDHTQTRPSTSSNNTVAMDHNHTPSTSSNNSYTSTGAKDRARSPDVQEPSATRVQVRGPTSPSALPALSPKGVSPPLYAQNGSSVSLSPPSITTRQLGKVKRFLTTVVQFGQDISYETGDKVKTLVLSLVSSTVSVEEFHHSLQEVTNFPLRPFVMPFLRAYLPPLQREISAQARALKMPLVQYLRQHEHAVLDPAYSASEPSEIFHHTEHPDKRRSTTDSCFENGLSEDTSTYMPPAAKRPHLSSSTVSPGSAVHPPPPASHGLLFPPLEHSALYATAFQPTHQREAVDEEWKNIHVMLNCILSMVEKTKRALGILQQRSVAGWGSSGMSGANGLSEDVKRTAADILAHTIRVTEDRIADVKRKAEEAVNEVRRQAVAELQRAVAAAESKACELVAAERTRVERLASEARKKVEEPSVSVSEVASPSPPSASSQHNACWNCGRKANETCSGCNTARYCGAFCQHKDWDTHHQVCCLTGASTSSISGRSMSQPTPTDKAPCPPFTAVAVAAASAAASSGIHANPTIKPSSPVATAAAASTSANSPSPSTPASSAPPPPPLPASSCTSSASSTSSSVSATSSPSPSGRK